MKNFYIEHKEFIYAVFTTVFTIAAGATIGFVAARFINEKLSNHAFRNCPAENLVFLPDSFVGGKYICLKK
jgi:hypothetical protein